MKRLPSLPFLQRTRAGGTSVMRYLSRVDMLAGGVVARRAGVAERKRDAARRVRRRQRGTPHRRPVAEGERDVA